MITRIIKELAYRFKMHIKFRLMLKTAYGVKFQSITNSSRKPLFELYLDGIEKSDFKVLHQTMRVCSKRKINENWEQYINIDGTAK